MEMAFISVIGNWLKGIGWVGIFKRSKVNTIQRIENFLVYLALLVYLSNVAFKYQTEFDSYDIWRNEIKKRSVNARYRLTVFNLEFILFISIKSIRNADFDLQGLIWVLSAMRPVIGRYPKDRETKKVFMLIYVKNCKKKFTRKWGYCGKLPCEGPQVLFGTPIGAPFCFERRTFVSTKTYFSKHVTPPSPVFFNPT